MYFAEHGVVYWVNAWKTSGQPRINGLNYRVENVVKQLVHESAVRSSRYEALGSLGSYGYGSSNSYVSFVLSKLLACFISR